MKTIEKKLNMFCVLPWIAQHISTNGAIAPCCEYEGKVADYATSSLEEAWNSGALASVRSEFSQGKVPQGCRKCVDREASEGCSLRTENNKIFSEHYKRLLTLGGPDLKAPQSPIAYMFRFSNLCNFKCRTCWHGASSKWFSDAKVMNATATDSAEIKSIASVASLIDQISPHIADVEEIAIAGGEPFITPEHYDFLDALVELGNHQVRLRYNSNMSQLDLKGRSIFDYWDKFKNVELQASVDANDKLGEMVRYGFNWDTYVSNTNEVRARAPHVKLTFGITVSALNVADLPKLITALIAACDARDKEFHLHSLQDPPYYRTQVLPAKVKAKVDVGFSGLLQDLRAQGYETSNLQQQLQRIQDYMHAEERAHQLHTFTRVSESLDRLRDEDTSTLLPHLAADMERSKSKVRQTLARVKRSVSRRLSLS